MNVRIVMSKHGRGEVFIDGEKVKAVRGVTVSMGVHQLNLVSITYIADFVEFEGIADVTTIEHEFMEFRKGELEATENVAAH